MLVATFAVAGLPGVVTGALHAGGVIDSWPLSIVIACGLSIGVAAAGSAWWVRRPASRDIVFADLMVWGWLRRMRTERRLASATWLLGRIADLDPARQVAELERLSAALEARDSYTHGHSKRVTRHAYMIARQLGLPREQAARIRTAAAVHDVGKIETPREVLNKPGKLTDEEFAVIQRHPVDGAAMIAGLGDDELAAIVRHHHERLDGGGYPDGLHGEQIPLGARVIAVADTFDALTSNRSYRSGCRHKKALDILRKEAGTQLDPQAVGAFLGYYTGRRTLPWWSAAAAAAPSRLVSWGLSGIQGATAAPLASGAAAVGATLAVGGALAGAPADRESARHPDAPVAQKIAATYLAAQATKPPGGPPKQSTRGGDSEGRSDRRSARGDRRPAAGGHRRGGSSGAAGGTGTRHDGAGAPPGATPSPESGGGSDRVPSSDGGGGDPGGGGGSNDLGSGGGGSNGGGSNGGGSNGGGSSNGGGGGVPNLPRLPQVPTVPQLPPLPTTPNVPGLPNVPGVPNLPRIPRLPKLP